jgi:hypothetical protein
MESIDQDASVPSLARQAPREGNNCEYPMDWLSLQRQNLSLL